MLAILSPAKTLDLETTVQGSSSPKFSARTKELVGIMKTKSPSELKSLMSISDKLANLNHDRYQNFSSRYTAKNSHAAIYSFKGDVYIGLDVNTLSEKDVAYTQDHVRILSGLYGLLKPLDKMQPYRLEMGTRLTNARGKNLYQFWGDMIAKEINKTLKNLDTNILVNLASNEYYKAVDQKTLKADIVNIGFKEERDGKMIFISYNAKKARGLMTRYIVKHKIDSIEDLKGFDYEDYHYNEALSSKRDLIFSR